MNNVSLIGRLTADPELKTTQSGVAVTSFDLAVDRYWNGEKSTDFFTVVAWRKTAELAAQYLEKGRQAGVKGRLQTRKYEDKHGNKRSKVEIVAEELDFLGGKQTQQESPEFSPMEAEVPFEAEDGELPF